MATEVVAVGASPGQANAADQQAVRPAAPDAGGFSARRLAFFLAASLLLAGGITVAIILWARESGFGFDTAIGAVGWRVLATAVLLHVGAHMAWAARLWLVGHGTGDGITYAFAFRLVTAGVFGAAITPGRAGGEGLRYILLRRHHPEPDHAMRFLVADRTLDFCFFILAGIPAAIALPVLLGGDVAYRAAAVVGVVVLSILFGVLALLVTDPGGLRRLGAPLAHWLERRMPKSGRRLVDAVDRGLDHTRDGLRLLLTERKLYLAGAAALTLCYWTLEFLVLWVLLGAFGFHPGVVAVLLGAVVLNLVTAAAATPGASGIAELAALAIYQGMAPGLSPLFVVLWRMVTYGYDLAVGGAVAFREGMLTLGRRSGPA
ncbi:MAG TPA: flippase-like domain-containing protein [Candidatus Thermoplasmatota archaeon]|nr:flippase-like domain-containing protein [Candidatus Thermoplasmatota archaeon]